jgi:hypothetical protein
VSNDLAAAATDVFDCTSRARTLAHVAGDIGMEKTSFAMPGVQSPFESAALKLPGDCSGTLMQLCWKSMF